MLRVRLVRGFAVWFRGSRVRGRRAVSGCRGDFPRDVAAPVRLFHLQTGTADNKEKERASTSLTNPGTPRWIASRGPAYSAVSSSTFFTFQAQRETSGWKSRNIQLGRHFTKFYNAYFITRGIRTAYVSHQ